MQLKFKRTGKRANCCIFCKRRNLTEEHIFPKWTRHYFDKFPRKRAGSSFGVEYPDHTDAVVRLLPGPLRDWTVKSVCGGPRSTCNAGWMKDIEDKAKPIMLPLFDGEPTRLSPVDLETIATWAALKVMVADSVDGGAWAVHHKQREYMYAHKRPPLRSWTVWLGRFERKEWRGEWVSRPFNLLPRGAAHDKKLGRLVRHYNCNSVTQVIGQVLIHVIHAVDQRLIVDWRFSTPQKPTLSAPFFKIWPPSNTSIVWPPRALSDQDADHVSRALSTFLNKAVYGNRRPVTL
jgi:hypothetical protein